MVRSSCFTAAVLLSCALTGCVLGSEQPPGCRLDHPEDCESGWTCRAGLCVRPTTSLSLPEAGDGEPDGSLPDAADDAPAETSSDAASEPIDAPDTGPQDATQDTSDAPSDGAGDDGAMDAALD